MVTGYIAALLTAGMVTGCGTGGSGLERDAARQLQARVLEVTQASSQNDPNAALKALEGLETELAAAQQRGDISEERRRSITTIATAVRADLKDAVAAAELAAAKAAEEKSAAEKAAAEQAAATPSPTTEA
ncbi:FIMAH domain-containing protein, partial [Escherichia coli]|uniref:FIMAH domain-containing protein n=1 Tax=Escherichia coli TaxID=562 RepID=UPI0032E3B76C